MKNNDQVLHQTKSGINTVICFLKKNILFLGPVGSYQAIIVFMFEQL